MLDPTNFYGRCLLTVCKASAKTSELLLDERIRANKNASDVNDTWTTEAIRDLRGLSIRRIYCGVASDQYRKRLTKFSLDTIPVTDACQSLQCISRRYLRV